MKRFPLSLFVLLILSAACSTAAPTPFAATLPAEQRVNLVPSLTPSATPTITLTPTATDTPTPTNTPTPTFTPTNTLTPTITPSPTPTLTFTPSDTPTPIPTSTFSNPADDPNYTPPPSWTPPPSNPGAGVADHFRLRRPISSSGTDWVDRTYPYGSTSGGRYRVHHGVEFQNPNGTPVLATAPGTVYYAGEDIGRVFGPQPNYYGNVVVIQHDFTSPEGQAVYTLYGHLSQIAVETGARVDTGQRIGAVGASGVALGSHLHFEVRLGEPENFNATRNPELWIYPYGGFGLLAGRVTDANGNPLQDVTLQVETASGERSVPRYAYSYAGNSVNSDATIGENFTLGDLPATYYDVTVRAGGRRLFQQIVYVYPNQTTWLDVKLSN